MRYRIKTTDNRSYEKKRIDLHADVSKVPEKSAILDIYRKYDALERTHRSNQAVAASLFIMGAGATIALMPAGIGVKKDCATKPVDGLDCASSICILLAAIAGVASLGGSITSLVLNRSNLCRHVEAADRGFLQQYGTFSQENRRANFLERYKALPRTMRSQLQTTLRSSVPINAVGDQSNGLLSAQDQVPPIPSSSPLAGTSSATGLVSDRSAINMDELTVSQATAIAFAETMV